MPEVYLGPAYLLSISVGAMALVRAGLWLRHSNGRVKTGDSEAEFRGEMRAVQTRQTEILLSLTRESTTMHKILDRQTMILERLTAREVEGS